VLAAISDQLSAFGYRLLSLGWVLDCSLPASAAYPVGDAGLLIQECRDGPTLTGNDQSPANRHQPIAFSPSRQEDRVRTLGTCVRLLDENRLMFSDVEGEPPRLTFQTKVFQNATTKAGLSVICFPDPSIALQPPILDQNHADSLERRGLDANTRHVCSGVSKFARAELTKVDWYFG
jgi:hypothetical protein